MLGMLDGDFEINDQQKVVAPKVTKFDSRTARAIAEKVIADKERPAIQERIACAAQQGSFAVMLHTRLTSETIDWLKSLGFQIDYPNGECRIQW